jgi:hypothetical protein
MRDVIVSSADVLTKKNSVRVSMAMLRAHGL